MRKAISLQVKLIFILLLSTLIPLIGMVIFSILNSNTALKKSEENKLVAIREIKKVQLQDFFNGIEGDISFLADTSNTILNSTKNFITYHQEMNIGPNDNFDNSSNKKGLTKTYKEIHDPLDKYITKYLDTYSYSDILIICKKHGHVLYSYKKDSDYLENIGVGKYKDTHLAETWSNIVKTDKSYISDLKKYLPSKDEPVMFIGAPVRDEGETIAIVVVRISKENINKIIQEKAGMGKTGEAYIVGSDYYMKSDSRIIKEQENKSTALIQKAEIEQVKKALSNETGIMNSTGIRNTSVLSAYTLLSIGENIKWAIITEIDTSEAYSAVNSLTVTTLILLFFVIIILLIVGFIFSRSISKPITKISETLTNSSGQIAIASNQLSGSSQEIANGATEQASSIEETTSSMEELSSMVKQNVQNANEASTLADKTAGASQTGFVQMEKMLESMNEINKASSQIQKIIKVIDDIAFQTNILALNAAVEAARAGEAGMGFAVVADEVKNLANKSAEAAKETAAMIEDTIKKTGGGLDIATKLAVAFKDILTNAQKVSEMAKEVETASRQQDTGINQVNKAIIQFDEVVQANASTSEETASSAEELLAQVETLNGIVSQLVLIVTGKENKIEQHQRDQAEYKTMRAKKLQQVNFEKKQLLQTEYIKKKEIDPEKIIPFEEDEEFKQVH